MHAIIYTVVILIRSDVVLFERKQTSAIPSSANMHYTITIIIHTMYNFILFLNHIKNRVQKQSKKSTKCKIIQI